MRVTLALTTVAVLCCSAAPGAHAAAQQPCGATAADAVADSALLPYAQAHAPKVYKGGIARLHYQRGTLACRDITGDGRAEMIVRMNCCTGGAPTPWGIFARDASGRWRLRYARAADTVFTLTVEGGRVRATMPDPYEGACTPFVRSRVVSWNGKRFDSHMTARRRRSTPC
jgi:hypothetical protein